jgi:hypothetical protein
MSKYAIDSVNNAITSNQIDNAYNKKIINLGKSNGRVNLMDQPDPTMQFKMAEKVAIRNKATEYRGAIAGEWEDNLLSQVFFSAGNMQIIQNAIRAGVYKMSKGQFTVLPQNPETLKIIMRSVYIQYAQHYQSNVTKQVEELNSIVLEYAVQNVYNESVAYMKYCEDVSSLNVPFEMPKKIDRDYKDLESSREFFVKMH